MTYTNHGHLPKMYLTTTTITVFALLLILSNTWCFDTEINQFNDAEEIDFSFDNIHFLAVDKDKFAVNFWRIDTK